MESSDLKKEAAIIIFSHILEDGHKRHTSTAPPSWLFLFVLVVSLPPCYTIFLVPNKRRVRGDENVMEALLVAFSVCAEREMG